MTQPSSKAIAARPVIYLIGFRGTGKTTVARLLAERLGWQWVDADAVVESRYDQSIREIFATEGEPGFRRKEAAVLDELCTLQQHVVATGGGVVLRPDNRWKLKETGWVIWLTAEPATIWARLQQDKTTAERRPNLAQGGFEEIEELLRTRTPLYAACSDYTVDTTDRSPEEVAALIHASLPAC